MWRYHQRTGILEHDHKLVATGYSGIGVGKNNPAMQHIFSVGPIPQGRYIIEGPPYHSVSHGPFVLMVRALHGTQTFGRAGFLIHGDSIKQPGNASLGCLIFPRVIREKIWSSGDSDLEVVSGDEVTQVA